MNCLIAVSNNALSCGIALFIFYRKSIIFLQFPQFSIDKFFCLW